MSLYMSEWEEQQMRERNRHLTAFETFCAALHDNRLATEPTSNNALTLFAVTECLLAWTFLTMDWPTKGQG